MPFLQPSLTTSTTFRLITVQAANQLCCTHILPANLAFTLNSESLTLRLHTPSCFLLFTLAERHQEACDAANCDVARVKWLELEMQRQRQLADSAAEDLSFSEQERESLQKRIRQLQVGSSPGSPS